MNLWSELIASARTWCPSLTPVERDSSMEDQAEARERLRMEPSADVSQRSGSEFVGVGRGKVRV